MIYKNPLTFCAFCNKPLNKNAPKPAIKPGVGILCKNCENGITRDLGDGWQDTDWWKDFKESYWKEENQRNRDHSWSYETLKEQEESGYIRNIPSAQIDGTRINVPVGSLRGIIKRLNQSYGYGARRISKILYNTYKIKISSVGVTHHLTDMRRDEDVVLLTAPDAKFWLDWHEDLNRMERERERGRKEKIIETILSEEPTEEPSDDQE